MTVVSTVPSVESIWSDTKDSVYSMARAGVAKAAGNDKKDQMDAEAIFNVTIVSGLDALDARF